MFSKLVFTAFSMLFLFSCTTQKPLTPKDIPANVYYYTAEEAVYCKSKEFIRKSDGRRVNLIGMVHIADPQFYRKVQEEIDKADVVLEEAVDGLPTPQDIYLFNLQTRAQSLLHLASQTDALESSEKWISADLNMNDDPEHGMNWALSPFLLPYEMVKGEPVFLYEKIKRTLFWMTGNRQSYVEATRKESFLEFNKDFMHVGEEDEEKEERLKKAKDKDKFILDIRNENVIKVLEKKLEDKEITTVAIPWGAAHGEGLEKLLLEKGFEETTSHWNKAIAISDLKSNKPDLSKSEYFSFHIPYVLRYDSYLDSGFLSLTPLYLFYSNFTETEKLNLLAWGLGLYTFSDEESSSGGIILGTVSYDFDKESSSIKLAYGALLNLEKDQESNHFSTAMAALSAGRENKTDYFKLLWGHLLSIKNGKENQFRILPSFFGAPLLYEYSQNEEEEGKHKFLLFFEI